MRILIVCSGNAPNFDFQKHQAFIYDQMEAIIKADSSIYFDYFFIDKKGMMGYLSCLSKLKKRLKNTHYDCIHAHFATSALLANLQRKTPVVSTFHGSDIDLIQYRFFSFIVALLSKEVIYVSNKLWSKALLKLSHKSSVVPCGVNFEIFRPQDPIQSRMKMGLLLDKKYVLFSSDFETKIKNPDLAFKGIKKLQDANIHLLALKNYSRNEVAILMNAVDAALMTSFSEGSPQFVKEALACNCPVVSTDVGDVSDHIKGIQGCFITNYEVDDVAEKLKKVLQSAKKLSDGREYIKHLDNVLIASQIIKIYSKICPKSGI